MSTRSVGIACLALAVLLALFAMITALGGPSPDDYAQLISRAAILIAPVLAVVTGLYLLRKAPTYY